ncbi:hypothetical protein ES703_08930 [subsurface metagenome]
MAQNSIEPTGLIKVPLGGEVEVLHRKTGKPIRTTQEKVGDSLCDECGAKHPVYINRPWKNYNPDNILRRQLSPPKDYYIPVYDSLEETEKVQRHDMPVLAEPAPEKGGSLIDLFKKLGKEG